jgi:hypothetical protein
MRTLILGLSSAVLLSACATVTRGPNADMVIDTEPPGATVTTDLPAKGKREAGRGCAPTPCDFEVPRKADFLMTISKPGFEPMEIGVISRGHKESLRANLTGSGATGLTVGTGLGVALIGGGIGEAVFTTGEALALGATAGGILAGGVGLVSLGVDATSGALKSPNPNPVFIEMAPEGAEREEHPTVERLRIWRMDGPEGREARRAYKRAEKEARREAKAERKAQERAAKDAERAARDAAKAAGS